MPDSRWRSASIPAREALLLLPELPASVRGRSSGAWAAALGSWPAAMPAPGVPAAPDLLVAGARGAAASGADLVLVEGRDRAHRLRRAGYATCTYVAKRADAGAVLIEPAGRAQLGASIVTLRRGPRHVVLSVLRRVGGRRYLTIGRRGPLTPHVVAATVGTDAGAPSLLAGGGGPRRRSALLVPRAGERTPSTVVKVGPPAERGRGEREQQVLRQLHDLSLGAAVPTPGGAGGDGRVCWSVESYARGRPLAEVLARRSQRRGVRRSLGQVAEWLAALGLRTRSERSWKAGDEGLPLRGEHAHLSALRTGLLDVPAVLVHGDLGTAFNVLVDGASFTLLDWETSSQAELPLTDLLPLLCGAAAAQSGAREPASGARFILRLCAGHEEASPWLLSAVASYCDRVGVPRAQAGALAALAFGYQASMPLVQQELLARSGAEVVPWTTPYDLVARSWLSYPGLGLQWPALQRVRG